MYVNPEFKFGAGTGNLGVAGNSNLKAQQTISGEVGVQQAFTDDISVDLTAYFRDIRNLAGTRADEIRILVVHQLIASILIVILDLFKELY